MSDEKDPKKDETTEGEVEDAGCDCDHCPGCGAPEKPEVDEK